MQQWISLIESGYDLEGTLDAWLERVVEAAVPLLDAGGGVTGHVFDALATSVRLRHLTVRGGAPALHEYVRAANEGASPDALAAVYRSGIVAGTLSESLFASVDGEARRFHRTMAGHYRDAMGILAVTGMGNGLSLSAALPDARSMTDVERSRWTRVAAHLGAGLRLRLALESIDLEASDVEAVLQPSGAVVDARGEAEGADARRLLRAVVLDRERARGDARGDPDAALALWEALVRGRWSIVDHFDTDGRRFVVARRNDPRFADLRGLAARERQVAEFVGLGRTTKEIAYLLGVGESAVGNAAHKAQAKLGLCSRAELATFFAPGGVRARLVEASIAGEPLALGSYGLLDPAQLASLTDSEREVTGALLRGDTNAEIARCRGSSTRTVANQVRAIFEKLDVHSRAELAAALYAGG